MLSAFYTICLDSTVQIAWFIITHHCFLFISLVSRFLFEFIQFLTWVFLWYGVCRLHFLWAIAYLQVFYKSDRCITSGVDVHQSLDGFPLSSRISFCRWQVNFMANDFSCSFFWGPMWLPPYLWNLGTHIAVYVLSCDSCEELSSICRLRFQRETFYFHLFNSRLIFICSFFSSEITLIPKLDLQNKSVLQISFFAPGFYFFVFLLFLW